MRDKIGLDEYRCDGVKDCFERRIELIRSMCCSFGSGGAFACRVVRGASRFPFVSRRVILR